MAKRYLTSIDLSKNQILNVAIHNLSSAPTSPVFGQLYYNTISNRIFFYNGTTWVDMTGAIQNIAGGAGLTASSIVNGTVTLDINVDNATVEINNDILRIKDLGITSSKINDGAITTIKIAGNNVTLNKLQQISSYTALGNVTGSQADVSQVVIVTDLANASTTTLATSTAIKTYIDTTVGGIGNLEGSWDASTATFPVGSTPVAGTKKGDYWYVTTAGTVGGVSFNIGDVIIAKINSASTTLASDWIQLEVNRDQATETVLGIIRLATQSELTAGTNDTAAITPYKLKTYLTGNPFNYLTSNQSISLTGAITGSGTTAITTSLATGIVGISNLSATGTPSASTYLRGDNTWASILTGGTVTSVAALTLGTSGTDLSSSVANGTTTPVITLNVPTASATNRGALSSTDWSTFNGKQATITLTTTGSSGSASFITNTLNIPAYTLAGLGGQASSTNLTSLSGLTYASTSFVKMTGVGTFTLDTTSYYAASNPNGYTSNVGTVTSVAALTLGTTGTDVSSTVATGTTTPVITLNLPSASAANRGLLTSADWTTFNNKQVTISLTTTGSSGAATFSSNTLNIPNYTLAGLGGVATSRTLTINGTTYDLSADRSWTISAGSSALSALTDVVLTSPQNNDVLKYDTATGKWINGVGGAAGNYVTVDTTQTVTGVKTFRGSSTDETPAFTGNALTSSGWATGVTGWTGTYPSWTVVGAGSSSMTNTVVSAISNYFYVLTITATTSVAGKYLSCTFGGASFFVYFSSTGTQTVSVGAVTTTTGSLSISATGFDGSISAIDIKSRSNFLSPATTFATSTGGNPIEVRVDTITNSFNTFFGYRVGRSIYSGTKNTAVGNDALSAIQTGYSNVAIGYYSQVANVTAYQNVSVGNNALASNIVGQDNTAIGNYVLSLYKGSFSTFLGSYSGSQLTGGSSNIGIGTFALVGTSNSTPSGNIAIGYSALYNAASNSYNVAVGYSALEKINSGSNNIAFGYRSAYFISGGVTNATTIDNSIFIGYQTYPLANSQTNQIVIGYNVVGLGSNTTSIGNSSTTLTYLYGSLQQTAVTSSMIKVDSAGKIVAATAGTDYLTSVGISNLTATGTPSSTTYLRGDNTWATITAGGSGTVTSVSVVSANGFAGTVATATSTPAITISTSITGLLKGDGTSISAAAAGVDYLTTNQDITLSGAVTGTGTTNITTTLSNGVVGIANLSATGTPSASTYLRGDNTWGSISGSGGGTVTSVALSMPSAFTVTNSPVTSAGTLTVVGAGTSAQYITGDGSLATFPSSIASASQMTTFGRNSTGVTLYRGTVVYISGSTGNVPNFTKSQASGEGTSARTFGIVKDDIANNADGYVITSGSIDNLDTRSNATHPFTSDTLVDGDTVYLDPTTAGYITKVKPSAPNHLVYIGKVIRTSPTNGTIVYQIQNGYELDELHDVQVGSYVNKDILYRDTATNLWKNASIATVLGYTPYNSTNPSGYLTSVAYGDLTGTVPTWNQNTTGNAATVTNGVYLTATQTLTNKTLTDAKLLNTIQLKTSTVGTYSPFVNTMASFVGSANDYQLLYIQNLSNGSDASADFVAYNDASDVNSYFIDMGISGSNYSSTVYPIFPANSGYLYTGGGTGAIPSDLYIGTGTASSDIVLFVGGTELSNKAVIIKSGTKNVLINQTSDTGENLQVTGGAKITGDITITGSAYASGDILTNPHQLVTKEYVDVLVSAGIHIHQPVRLEQGSNLTATYTQGGTTPTITAISSGSILTSAGHNLAVDDMIVFTATGNGIISGQTYFVYEVLSANTFTISATLLGPALTGLTNGTGLSLTSRANSGVGATLTNSGTQAALVIDGVTVAVNDRILVYGQTIGYQNGIYTVTSTGSGSTNWVLTRATDANKYGAQDPQALGGGDYFFITSGNTGAGESYVISNTGEFVFGTDTINFTLFNAAPTYTGGTNINVAGQIISLTGTVGATNGGTGTATVTTGDLLYGSAANTWSKLGLGVAYKSLIVNASGSQLEWNAIPLNQSAAVSGQLSVANGGTGQSTYTDGQLLIGNSLGNTLSKATLSPGSGISITNGNGTITIAATGSGGISGTTNNIAKFTSASTVGDSIISDSGTSVSINGTTIVGGLSIAASAQLQIDSTTKGFLPPRMTSTQRTNIGTPAVGLVVYQTDGVEGLYLNTSAGWKALTMV